MGVCVYITELSGNLGHPDLGGLPWVAHIVQGELSTICTSPPGEDTGKLCLVFPELYLFAFADFSLSSFAIINCNSEYNSSSELCESF